MIAVAPVRDGVLALGCEEAIAEAGGHGLLIGSGATQAARDLAAGIDPQIAPLKRKVRELSVLECSSFQPGKWARVLAKLVAVHDVVILPATPDGRDLAPRLARELARPLLSGAVWITERSVLLARHQGRQIARYDITGPFVATLLVGTASAFAHEPSEREIPATSPGHSQSSSEEIVTVIDADSEPSDDGLPAVVDCEIAGVLHADPAAIDLAEADRIFAAGAGLGGEIQIAMLKGVAQRLGASVGATRVVTDAGLLGHERQIGTTGVSVSPRCYVAFGISGAAQHVGGLGHPRHVISANLDRSCPMMSTADLALVTDAKALLQALARRLEAIPEGVLEGEDLQ